jgi:hypothetical protein
MKLHRWTLCLLSIPLFPSLSAAQATLTDHYTMHLDSAQSQVQYVIDTTLGPCTLSRSPSGFLSGDLVVLLNPGANPISTGEFDGGDCSCHPDLVGTIPSSQPGLPPLLEVHLGSLVLQHHSTPFNCDSGGRFATITSCVVAGGTLEVSVGGAAFVSVPIVGTTSDSTSAQGRVSIDATGIHVEREFQNTLDIGATALGLGVQIGMRGKLDAQMPFPVPTRFCPAAPNSTGLPAMVEFSGTPSVSRNDGRVLVRQCPADATGTFIAGDQQGQVPFGNGVRCATGTILRARTIQVSSTGAGSWILDLRVPPLSESVLVGSRWNFQFLYRDDAAAGAKTNASDAIAVDFVP